MTPPDANGMSPDATGPAMPELPNRSPNPSVNCLNNGLNAFVSAILDSRKASDFSTSSNCLPPATASLNALRMALANCVALTPSALALVRALSAVSGKIAEYAGIEVITVGHPDI